MENKLIDIFEYRLSYRILINFICPISVLLSFGFGVRILYLPCAIEKNYWIMSVILFAISIAIASFGGIAFLGHRPLSVEVTGVSTYLFGQRNLHIGWDKVTQIERRRYLDPQNHEPRYKYFIYGENNKIRFDDQIVLLKNLLEIMTDYAKKYKIEIIATDAGIDTKKLIKRTVSSASERKKLLREGVKTRITEL